MTDFWRYAAYPDAHTFADLLRGLRGVFPAALIDGRGWTRLLECTADAPAAGGHAFGIDFALDDLDPVVDVSFTAAPGTPVAAYFMRRGQRAAPDTPAARFGRCLEEQGRGRPDLVRWTHRTGVTFDVDVPRPAEGTDPGPIIYLGLRREAEPQREAGRAAPALLAELVGWPADEQEQAGVQRAFEALPEGAWINWAGVMPGRRRSIRLVAGGIDAAEILACLERLCWPGSMRAAETLLAEMRDMPADFTQLLLDVTASGPSPVFGVEVAVGESPPGLTTGANDWRPLIDRLEATGRCLPEKGRTMLAWLGRERIFTPHGGCLVWKGLNHVKLTVKGEAIHTKAYPGVVVSGAVKTEGDG